MGAEGKGFGPSGYGITVQLLSSVVAAGLTRPSVTLLLNDLRGG